MNTFRRLLRTRRVSKTILAAGFTLCVGVALVYAPGPAKAQIEADELEELILSVQVGRYLLSDGVLAYQYQDRYYLPMIALSEELSFFIDPDLSRNAVSGWAGTEDNTYTIDASRGELIIRGRRESLSPTETLPADMVGTDDLYVQQEVLAKIWPINAAVNLPNLSLDVLVDEDAAKLPFMLRIERRAARKIAEAKQVAKATETAKTFIYKPNPYRPVGLPVVDIETQYGFGTKQDNLTNITTLTGVMDLLWAKADFSASSNYADKNLKGPDTLRLRLQRDTTPDEPLPLGLRMVEGGDVRVSHAALVKGGTSGRGVRAATTDKNRTSEFDVITVEGTGPIGWEVELYRNAELLDFTVVDDRGEYRFEDVQLNFGNNQIRRILYGPQGQIREVVDNYVFGSNMLKPGTFDYSIGAVDAEKDFIRLREDPNAGRKIQGAAMTMDAAYGINRNITAYGALTTLPVRNNASENEIRDYFSAGSAVSLPFGVAQIEAYQDISRDSDIEKKGRAAEGRFITQILGFKLNFRGAFFNDFESPDAGFGNGARKFEGQVGVNRNVRLPFGQLGLNLDYEHGKNIDGNTTTQVGFRQSLSHGGMRFANTFLTNLTNGKHQSTTGQLSVTSRFRKIRLRSNLSYDHFPERQLTAFDGEIRFSPNKKMSAALSASHNFINSINGAGAQLTYDFDRFLGSVEGRWEEGNDFTFGLRASTSLGPYGPDGGYLMQSERLSSISPVRARVFMDYDDDGVFSDGDDPVTDAKVTVNGRRSDQTTDEYGFVTSLFGSGVEEATISVDRGTLLDPYHLPANDGYTTVVRPGSIPYFDIPVIETGAIDGIASKNDGEPLQGMRLELVNDKGEIVASTETAYDGFYTFEYVRPGNYTVRADPAYGVNVPPQSVAVASEELFASGIDLQLLEQAVEAEAEEGADVQSVPDEAERESGEVAQPNHAPSDPVQTEKTDSAQNTGTVQPALLSSSADDANMAITVERVRIGEHPDSVRLVMDLSGPIRYTLAPSADGTEIHVDLPDTDWVAAPVWQGRTTPVLAGYRVENLPGKAAGARLVLQGHEAGIAPGLHGVLPPEGAQGYRLYIDLKRK